jgi:multidrug transporter EmrE-like cation transporter
MIPLLLLVFWAMQVMAFVALKYGSTGPGGRSRRWLAGFLVGNAIGSTSMWFQMMVYERMPENPNLVAVLTGAGASIGIQIALALLFRSRLSLLQWAGIATVILGSLIATYGGPAGVAP